MKGAREGKRAKKKETRKARERCLATLAPDRRDLLRGRVVWAAIRLAHGNGCL